MADLIERQAVIDALDVGAEALRHILNTVDIVGAEREKYKLGLGLIESCISDIKDLPSAQPDLSEYSDKLWRAAYERGKKEAQAEIIRCKECIYFDRYVDGIEKYQWDGFCADWARNTYEDWYCSRAERREE